MLVGRDDSLICIFPLSSASTGSPLSSVRRNNGIARLPPTPATQQQQPCTIARLGVVNTMAPLSFQCGSSPVIFYQYSSKLLGINESSGLKIVSLSAMGIRYLPVCNENHRQSILSISCFYPKLIREALLCLSALHSWCVQHSWVLQIKGEELNREKKEWSSCLMR